MGNKLISSRLFLTAILICLVQVSCNSQPAGKPQQLSVSVNGIDYDDAGFNSLREKLQGNKQVTGLKQNYSNGNATITFTCTKTAITLWDEMPSSVKQLFKVNSIDDQHIVLSGKGSNASAGTVANSNTSTANTDDCKTCYYNLCKYDVTKTFQGVLYKGINWDQGTYYYNCDNGVVTRKIITVNGNGVITGISTDTLIMSNVPEGTTWHVTKATDGSSFNGFTLVAKNLSVNVNNKQYSDVIIVNYRNYTSFLANGGASTNYYYARGAGNIKTEQIDYKKDPMDVFIIEKQAEATAES